MRIVKFNAVIVIDDNFTQSEQDAFCGDEYEVGAGFTRILEIPEYSGDRQYVHVIDFFCSDVTLYPDAPDSQD